MSADTTLRCRLHRAERQRPGTLSALLVAELTRAEVPVAAKRLAAVRRLLINMSAALRQPRAALRERQSTCAGRTLRCVAGRTTQLCCSCFCQARLSPWT